MNSLAKRQGKRPQDEADATRATMLDAALLAFADHGFEATSLRNVADQVGVTHALFRKHFGDKDAVWRASVDYGVERYAAALRKRAARQDRAVSTIKDQMRILLEITAKHPALVRMMVLEGTQGGDRTRYLADAWMRIGDEHRARFHDAQWDGALKEIIDGDLFLFVLTSGMLPLALPQLTNAILGSDIAKKAARDEHIDRLLRVLFD